MSRIRSVHPGFFKDERLVSTSMAARMLFIGLGVEADDKGIFEWKPLTLKMNIFPADNVDVAALLSELEAADAIRAYEIDGRKYGAIRNFRRFQRPKTPNSIHPISDEIGKYVALPEQISEIDGVKPEQFPPKGEKSPQMEDGGGKRKEEESISLEAERDFETWYSAYPRHVGKGQARKAYRTARKKASADELLSAVASAIPRFAGKDPSFIPHPASWLNGERWLDDDAPGQAAVNSDARYADKHGNLPGDPWYGVDY